MNPNLRTSTPEPNTLNSRAWTMFDAVTSNNCVWYVRLEHKAPWCV